MLLLHKTVFQGKQTTDEGKLFVRSLVDKYRNEDLKERRDWGNDPQ